MLVVLCEVRKREFAEEGFGLELICISTGVVCVCVCYLLAYYACSCTSCACNLDRMSFQLGGSSRLC